MILRANKLIIGLLMVAILTLAMQLIPALSANAASQGGTAACDTLSQASGVDCQEETTGSAIENVVKGLLNFLSIAAGFITVLMIIISGIKFVTSQGESAGVASAKKTLLYAIAGLVIVALAQVLVVFVIGRSTTSVQPSPAAPSRPSQVPVGGNRPI